MKAIKIYQIQSVLCLLLLIMLCRVNAQQKHMPLVALAEKFQNLEAVKMSSNGKYITSRLVYDLNRDTLLIFKTSEKDKPAGFRTKIGEHYFIGENTLLLPSGNTAELWNLQTGRQTFFKDIVQAKALKESNGFVIHYGPKNDNKFILYDQNGMPKQTLENVTNFFLLAEARVAAVTSDDGDSSQIFIVSATEKKKIYSSSLLIQDIQMGYGSSEIFISEKNKTDKYQSLKYLDFHRGELHALKDILPVNFNTAYLEKSRDEKGYFIRLWSEGKAEDGMIDIWYGSDRDLQQKYYPSGTESAYLWQPREEKIQNLGTKDLKNVISLGNGRYFLGINPSLLNDYTVFNPDIEINVLDALSDDWRTLGRFEPEIYVSGNGQLLLSPKNKQWLLYDLKENKTYPIGDAKLTKPFFTEDDTAVLFEGEDGLWQYNISSGKLSKLINANGYTSKIINSNVNRMAYSGISKNTVSIQNPLLVQLSDPDNMIMKVVRWHHSKETVIAEASSNLYTEPVYDNQIRYVCFIEQNYNLPPRLICRVHGKNKQILFQTNRLDKKVSAFRQETITYTDGQGNPCQGILFYPSGYSESGIYPMVVQIYEKQGKVKNQYLNLSLHNTEGFNTRVLLENGYFVFFPDIQYGSLGSGIAALQCVTNALDALKFKKQIDPKKIGLTGHSFGGYQTNFIATQSDRFAAYLSGTGNSDIVSGYHSFNLNYLMPSFWRFETFQYRMHKPFSEDKQLYYNNNPIYNAEKVNAPMLLWTGMEDENIKWEEIRSFYNALRRNKKRVIALFYRDEGHSLQNNGANLDLSLRTLDWFNYFLKDDHSSSWIGQEIKKGAD